MARWDAAPGIVEFPSGRRVRCRSWSEAATPPADLTVLITSADISDDNLIPLPIDTAGETVTIDWADGRLPRRPGQARQVLRDALFSAGIERVELVGGGSGRIGASLAIMSIHDGLSAEEAIEWVATNYADGSVDSHALRAFIKEVGEDEREGDDLPHQLAR